MENEKGYQGYTNYETWLLAFNLNNSQGAQDLAFDAALQSDDEKEFREALEEACYIEEYSIYKFEAVWTQRDWDDIDWTELFDLFKKDALKVRQQNDD
jgi:hypothetical protein